jgi:hypothetical protein
MLKVWRGKQGKLFAECTACGSYGTAGHIERKVKMTPEIEAALERHTAHMMTLRKHFEKASGTIAEQVRNGSLLRSEGTEKIKQLWINHVAQVHMGMSSLPDPEGKVTELATKCPWCSIVEEAEIGTLPEDKDHPDFELAVPVQKHLQKQLEQSKERG